MDKLRKDQNYSRRDILEFSAYGSLLALLPGCKTTYPKPDFRLIKNGIDAHCHVFNASDLPVGQFIQRVALKDYEDTLTLPSDNRESAVGGLASWLTNFLTGGSITAAEEIDALKDGRTIESPPVRTKELEDRRLKNSLETLLIGSQESAEGNTQRRFRKEDSPFLELVIDELQEEKAAAQKDSYTIDELSSGVTESGGSIGRTFQWARLLLKPRSKIVSTMNDLYGGEKGISLFTPALVDFQFWLDQEPRSPFHDQVEVMDLIQRRQTDGAMLHCFAPFNPLSEVMYKRGNYAAPMSPLDLVKYAIFEAGFIGVKMYPPNGFLPYGNQDYNRQNPMTVPERFEGDGRFWRDIDAALDSLYSFCAANDVPIMAHANDSNDAFPDSGRRADPVFWEPVLRNYKNGDRSIKLNLAHFGGFEEAFPEGDDQPTKPWETKIGEILNSGQRTLYSDLSYFSEFLGDNLDAEQRQSLVEMTRKFVCQYDPKGEHLIYGSDWSMIANEPQFAEQIGVSGDFLKKVGFDQDRLDRFFFWNSVNFLGLKKGEPSRTRLEAYAAKHGLDTDRYKIFDQQGPGASTPFPCGLA